MKELIIFIFIFFSNLFALEWEYQDSGVNTTLRDVCFVDSLTGWAVGDSGVIIHTNDGGNSWQRQTSPISSTLHQVQFVDRLHGTATIDWYEYPRYLSSSSFLQTNDGGKSWDLQTLDIDFIFDVQFLDQKTGYLCGGNDDAREDYGGFIYKTQNGGDSWQQIFVYHSPPPEYFVDIFVLDEMTAWVASTIPRHMSNQGLFATVGGDKNWEPIRTLENPMVLGITNQIIAVSKDSLWSYLRTRGQAGGIMISHNGGISWKELDVQHPAYDLYPISGSSSYYIERHHFIKIENSTEFKVLFSDTSVIMRAFDTPDRKLIWIVGEEGKIIKLSVMFANYVEEQELRSSNSTNINIYPNPFNQSTRISSFIQGDAIVKIKIYNMRGQIIKTLFEGQISCLIHTNWDGRDENGISVPAGIFLCHVQMKTNSKIQNTVQKLCLLK
jgi:hypothetical protein